MRVGEKERKTEGKIREKRKMIERREGGKKQSTTNQPTNGGHLALWLLPVPGNDPAKRIAK